MYQQRTEHMGHCLKSGQHDEGCNSLAQIKGRRMTVKGSCSAVAQVDKKLVFQDQGEQATMGLKTNNWANK